MIRRYLSPFDNWLSSDRILIAIVLIFIASIVMALFVTFINAKYYWTSYEPCVSLACFAEIPKAFGVQVRIVKFGVAAASFVALIFGSYLALKSYLTAAQVGAFGNRIAHIGLFERFIQVELGRKRRLNSSSVDVYSLYRLMYQGDSLNSSEASPQFIDALKGIYKAIEASGVAYRDDSSFKFENHRRDMISALAGIHIRMDRLPRIDFLEVEDEVVDFISVLALVFAPATSPSSVPLRPYR
ncbi:retron Ec48 family effector membrane protein [Stenotrophomonas maltophilia]|uniref:retron Ec48 family effector membrane protein n=1 Tax=Stenotrophomonas maltophilia TaxID=40324 RepID=UPI0013DC2023|nr:retron Ec48 family effector membrane protein [Stenotrophomonas maltophilia]